MIDNWAKIVIGDSRKLIEVENESIDLIVTSPPYWYIKDYNSKNQIGYGQTLHEYLKDLYRVWKECYRVLRPGRRICINIGDQFARSIIYGRYKIIPLHSEFIAQCEDIGFDYMGSIIWQKKTTMNTTGGANVMGSYPYPPNGIVELDYEYVLIFKKPGKASKVSREIKEMSRLTKDEWREYFNGHWYFKGAKQKEHQAMFPEELPKRLIKMFTFVGDMVLDPFVGSGTTIKAALNLNRNAIGFEINKEYLEIIRKKLNFEQNLLFNKNIQVIEREVDTKTEEIDYTPRIKDAKPKIDPKKLNFRDNFYKVTDIIDEETIRLNTGLLVSFIGVKIIQKEKVLRYLQDSVLKKDIYLKFDENFAPKKDIIYAYIYLKNKIFINAYLIKRGMAVADIEKNYKYKSKFMQLEKKAING